MRRGGHLLCIAFAAVVVVASAQTGVAGSQAGDAAETRKPNIVLIVADDLGYADLGVQGCTDVPTPHIDSIGGNGVRFTNAYVTCPSCSPSRAGMLTGKYQQRFGHEFNPTRNKVQPEFGLPVREKTLADRLKSFGYSTAAFGKWHLGDRPDMHPQKRGFDEFYGFLGGMREYGGGDDEAPLLRGTERTTSVGYTTEEFAREACAFISRHDSAPFFVYLSFNAVHTPLAAPQKYLARFAHIKDVKRRMFAAVLSAMDDGVGAVLQQLRTQQLDSRTLIFFLSDNGGPTSSTTSRNDPLRGSKGQLLEGGIRIPFLMQWKAQLQAGKVYEHPVISLNIAATCLAAAGVTEKDHRLDGVNLLPYVRGENAGPPHAQLFWRYGAQSAARMGDWKRLHFRGRTQLYNLANDIGEAHDLASAVPEQLEELERAYNQWNAQMAQPLWEPEPRVNKGEAAP